MSNVICRKLQLRSRPTGPLPAASDFELVEKTLPELQEGQYLVRNTYMSVDPYMFTAMKGTDKQVMYTELGQTLSGQVVGKVVASKSSEVAVGDYISHMQSWRDYAICTHKPGNFSYLRAHKFDLKGISPTAYLGVLGMQGTNAYAGVKLVANVQPGESVYVSAAAGGVGVMTCQILKSMGCFVVGSTGSDEKCKWLEQEAGVDVAINYKICGDLEEALQAACPDGFDVAFENVGGTTLEAAISAMKVGGRIFCCGTVSNKHGTASIIDVEAPKNFNQLIGKRLTYRFWSMADFFRQDMEEFFNNFFSEVGQLVTDGKLKPVETIEVGLENSPLALLKVLSGENLGKMLVKISDDD